MSKRTKYWFGYTCKVLQRYPKKLEEDGTVQAFIALGAINKAIEETRLKEDGEDRLKLMDLIFFRQNSGKSLEGAALDIHVSWRTAQRWKIQFVYMVARNMGF